MAVQIILDFESDADAKKFVKQVIEDNWVAILKEGSGDLDNNYTSYDAVEATIVGAFKRPTKFCVCPSRSGWTRGRGYGWWVCDNCHLPTERWTDNADRWRYALGVNLIPAESGGIQPKRGDLGDHDLDSPRIWRDLPPRTSQPA
jgi:hypothetical protein